MKAPERRFKGVWISKAIWEHKDLTWLQKCLVAEIDSLSDDDNPCTASNSFLADRFNVTTGRLANMLTQLRDCGVIETVFFDGRKRLLRVKADFTKNVKGVNGNSEDPFTDSVKAPISTTVTSEITDNAGLHRKFIQDWWEAYQKHFKCKYSFQAGRDGKAVKTLLALDDNVQMWIDLAQRAWASKGFWSKQAASISGFAAKVNEIRAELSEGAVSGIQRGRRPPPLNAPVTGLPSNWADKVRGRKNENETKKEPENS